MATEKQYKAITRSILASLKNGSVPWQKPWKAPRRGFNPNVQHNAVSGRPYRGMNVITLWAESAENGYESNAWMTYKQAQKLGGNVKRGQSGTTVSFWKFEEVEEVDPVTKKTKRTRRVTLRMFYVFNLDQTEGCKLPKRKASGADEEPFDVIELAQGVADNYVQNGGPSLAYDGIDSAYYRPATDAVHVPEFKQFNSPGEAYATLFHELGHSTGHESRLDRLDPGVKLAAFGSEDYSKEELVAEFTAAFLCAETGIDNTRDNSVAYIANWLRVLDNDPKMAMQAASKAQKASDLILSASTTGTPSDEADDEGVTNS
jgi:antirestriction protein ArdC